LEKKHIFWKKRPAHGNYQTIVIHMVKGVAFGEEMRACSNKVAFEPHFEKK
jgi:hypothetical protein